MTTVLATGAARPTAPSAYLVEWARLRLEGPPLSPDLGLGVGREGAGRPREVHWREARVRDRFLDTGVPGPVRVIALERLDDLLSITRDARRRIVPHAALLGFAAISLELDVRRTGAYLRVVCGVEPGDTTLRLDLRPDVAVPPLGPELEPICAIGAVALSSAIDLLRIGEPL